MLRSRGPRWSWYFYCASCRRGRELWRPAGDRHPFTHPVQCPECECEMKPLGQWPVGKNRLARLVGGPDADGGFHRNPRRE